MLVRVTPSLANLFALLLVACFTISPCFAYPGQKGIEGTHKKAKKSVQTEAGNAAKGLKNGRDKVQSAIEQHNRILLQQAENARRLHQEAQQRAHQEFIRRKQQAQQAQKQAQMEQLGEAVGKGLQNLLDDMKAKRDQAQQAVPKPRIPFLEREPNFDPKLQIPGLQPPNLTVPVPGIRVPEILTVPIRPEDLQSAVPTVPPAVKELGRPLPQLKKVLPQSSQKLLPTIPVPSSVDKAKRLADKLGNPGDAIRQLGGDVSKGGKNLGGAVSREGKQLGGSISKQSKAEIDRAARIADKLGDLESSGRKLGGDIAREGQRFGRDITREGKQFGADVSRGTNEAGQNVGQYLKNRNPWKPREIRPVVTKPISVEEALSARGYNLAQIRLLMELNGGSMSPQFAQSFDRVMLQAYDSALSALWYGGGINRVSFDQRSSDYVVQKSYSNAVKLWLREYGLDRNGKPLRAVDARQARNRTGKVHFMFASSADVQVPEEDDRYGTEEHDSFDFDIDEEEDPFDGRDPVQEWENEQKGHDSDSENPKEEREDRVGANKGNRPRPSDDRDGNDNDYGGDPPSGGNRKEEVNRKGKQIAAELTRDFQSKVDTELKSSYFTNSKKSKLFEHGAKQVDEFNGGTGSSDQPGDNSTPTPDSPANGNNINPPWDSPLPTDPLPLDDRPHENGGGNSAPPEGKQGEDDGFADSLKDLGKDAGKESTKELVQHAIEKGIDKLRVSDVTKSILSAGFKGITIGYDIFLDADDLGTDPQDDLRNAEKDIARIQKEMKDDPIRAFLHEKELKEARGRKERAESELRDERWSQYFPNAHTKTTEELSNRLRRLEQGEKEIERSVSGEPSMSAAKNAILNKTRDEIQKTKVALAKSRELERERDLEILQSIEKGLDNPRASDRIKNITQNGVVDLATWYWEIRQNQGWLLERP